MFFSAKFSFYEKDTKEDLFDKLMSGIETMKASFVNDDSVKALIVQDVIKKDERAAGHGELLTLVWNNLFSNAFKFTPEGGKVLISLKSDNNRAIIKVKDSGCGMSAETGAHIFEKFYQGDTSHAIQGNGLGLALIQPRNSRNLCWNYRYWNCCHCLSGLQQNT